MSQRTLPLAWSNSPFVQLNAARFQTTKLTPTNAMSSDAHVGLLWLAHQAIVNSPPIRKAEAIVNMMMVTNATMLRAR